MERKPQLPYALIEWARKGTPKERRWATWNTPGISAKLTFVDAFGKRVTRRYSMLPEGTKGVAKLVRILIRNTQAVVDRRARLKMEGKCSY